MSVAELKAYFVETFNMLEDFTKNVDVLLRHGFIEADNRLDAYSDSVDRVKITSYGQYMYSELAYVFTYLDLVCTDTGVFSEEVSNYLTVAARKEYNLFMKGERVERVRTRLDRVEKFIHYLRHEEMRERDCTLWACLRRICLPRSARARLMSREYGFWPARRGRVLVTEGGASSAPEAPHGP